MNILNPKGFSLMESVFGIAVIGVVSLGLMQLSNSLSSGPKASAQKLNHETLKLSFLKNIDCENTFDEAGIDIENSLAQCTSTSKVDEQVPPYFRIRRRSMDGTPKYLTPPLDQNGFAKYQGFWIRASCSANEESIIIRTKPVEDFNPVENFAKSSKILFGSEKQGGIPLCFNTQSVDPVSDQTTPNTHLVLVSYFGGPNFEVDLKDIIQERSFIDNFDFNSEPFKVFVNIHLMSAINYRGVASYVNRDFRFETLQHHFIKVNHIERNIAERLQSDFKRDPQCAPVADSVFESFQVDMATMNISNDFISLAGEARDLTKKYIYKFEARNQSAQPDQPCYPSIQSKKERGFVTGVIPTPTFDSKPWIPDDQPHTYGHGAYLYIDESGTMKIKGVSQNENARTFVTLGIQKSMLSVEP